MLKIKAWVFTPQVIICYILLVAILVAVISGKPIDKHTHLEVDKDGIIREYSNIEDDEYYGTHTLTYKDMKDYQIKVEDNGCTFWDGDRFVGYIPYNGTCRLDRLITEDNR